MVKFCIVLNRRRVGDLQTGNRPRVVDVDEFNLYLVGVFALIARPHSTVSTTFVANYVFFVLERYGI